MVLEEKSGDHYSVWTHTICGPWINVWENHMSRHDLIKNPASQQDLSSRDHECKATFFLPLFSSSLLLFSSSVTIPSHYRPHTPHKALDETAQKSQCNYWFLCLVSVPSISCQPPVAQGIYNKHPADTSSQQPFPDGCLPLPMVLRGHRMGSVHHFPCITSSARTQRASHSKPLKREYRGKHKLKRGWLGCLKAHKCTWGWQVKRSRRYVGWEGKCAWNLNFPPKHIYKNTFPVIPNLRLFTKISVIFLNISIAINK